MKEGSIESLNDRSTYEELMKATGMTYVGGGDTTEDIEEIDVD